MAVARDQVQPPADLLEEILHRRRRPFDDGQPADVHVRVGPLLVQERGVDRSQPVEVSLRHLQSSVPGRRVGLAPAPLSAGSRSGIRLPARSRGPAPARSPGPTMARRAQHGREAAARRAARLLRGRRPRRADRRARARAPRRARVRAQGDRPQQARRRSSCASAGRSSSTSETEVPEGAVTVFSAHGVAPSVRAERAGARPAHDRRDLSARHEGPREAARFAADGYTIVLVGHDGHEEVEGTMGEAPERIVLVRDRGGRRRARGRGPRAGRLHHPDDALGRRDRAAIIERLRERFPAIVGPRTDDICYATTNRQAAVKQLARRLRPGARDRLAQLVELACAWSRSRATAAPTPHLIDNAGEVREEWLAGQARRRHLLRRQRARGARRRARRLLPRARRQRHLRGRRDPRGRPLHAAQDDSQPSPPVGRPEQRHPHSAVTRTLVVSDLHLGGVSGVDRAAPPELRAPLLEALAGRRPPGAARRHARAAPRPAARGAARRRARSSRIGARAGRRRRAGRRPPATTTTLLVSRWLARARGRAAPEPLGLEQRSAREASPMLGADRAVLAPGARRASPTRACGCATDVYATHGHYLDCHLTVPTLERLGVGAMGRAARTGPPARSPRADDYEAVTAPIYAWRDAVARRRADRATPATDAPRVQRGWARASAACERASGGRATVGTRGSAARGCARGALRARVARSRSRWRRSTRRARARCEPSISTRRAAPRRACARWARWSSACGSATRHVVFGHTHRAGPLAGDDAGAEWRRTPNGARLRQRGLLGLQPRSSSRDVPARAPTGRERACSSRTTGPPVLKRLLLDRSHAS